MVRGRPGSRWLSGGTRWCRADQPTPVLILSSHVWPWALCPGNALRTRCLHSFPPCCHPRDQPWHGGLFSFCPHSFTAPSRVGAGTGHSTYMVWMAEDAVPASRGHTQDAIAIPTNTSTCYYTGVSALQVGKLPSASESFSPVVPLPPCTSSSPKATSLAALPRSAQGCGSSPACPSSTGPALAAAQLGGELPGGV